MPSPRPPKPSAPPDEVRLPRGEAAYRHLRAAIQDGRLPPGTRLRETDLAQQVGLSRTPIREALGRLAADGLVVHDAQRGVVVAELDYAMVTELYAMREVLEGTAGRLAAQHASPVEIDVLDGLCRQYETSLGDETALADCNWRFHETLYRCSHNRYLQAMVTTLHGALSLLGGTTLSDPERARESLEEHRSIVQAIRVRDADAAEQALREHIRHAQTLRMQRLFAAPR